MRQDKGAKTDKGRSKKGPGWVSEPQLSMMVPAEGGAIQRNTTASTEFLAEFKNLFGMNLEEVAELAQHNKDRTEDRLREEMADFFKAIDIEYLADALNAMVKGSMRLENLTDIKIASKLTEMLNSARKIFDVATRAWNTELEAFWDGEHKMTQLREPLIKTENSIANTTLIRFIRLMLVVIFEDSRFYTDPNHSCFDPAEVQKDKVKGSPEPHRIDADYFNIFKFMRHKDTQYLELSKHYDLMVTAMMNYAQENMRDRKKVRSADYIFIYEVLERLRAIMQDVELNKNKIDLLEKAGKLIAFVKLAIRIGLFSQVRWPWTVDEPQQIHFNGQGQIKVRGSLKMSQLLILLESSLTRILYEVQVILDDRSLYKHASRLESSGARLAFLRKNVYRHFASSPLFTDSDTYRLCAREDALRGAAPENHELALIIEDEKALGLKLHEPVFITAQEEPEKNPGFSVKLNQQERIHLSGIGSYPRDVRNLMRKYNPSAFQKREDFQNFGKDLLTLFVHRLPQMKHPKLAHFLQGQANDYAMVITLTHKLESILITMGQIVANLSRNSGEIELCLIYKKDMLDICAAMEDIYNMIMPILERMETRPNEIGQIVDQLGLRDILQDKTYRTLFCGSGLELIREIKRNCLFVKSDVQAFSSNLSLFDKSKFAAIIVDQIQDGHDLANMGFLVRETLLFCGSITNTQETALTFPLGTHQTLKPLSCDDAFVQRQAQWWGVAMAQEEAHLSLGDRSQVPLISAPATISREEDALKIASLEAALTKLKTQILAYHTPRLEANFYQTEAANFLRAHEEEAKTAYQAADEKARLRFDVKLLNHLLEQAFIKLRSLGTGRIKKSNAALVDELKESCREALVQAELKEMALVYGELQAQLETVKKAEQKIRATSNGAAYFAYALAISAKLRSLMKNQHIDLAELVETKIALEQKEIEDALEGPSVDVSILEDVSNDNNAPIIPIKALPGEEIPSLLDELVNAKMLFRQIAYRLLHVYTDLWLPPSAIKSSSSLPSLFSKNRKSLSPEGLSAEEIADAQTLKEEFKNSLCNNGGSLCFETLFAYFLENFSQGAFSQEHLLSTLQEVILTYIFKPMFLALESTQSPFLSHICAGLLLELSPLLKQDIQCLNITEYGQDDFKAAFAQSGGVRAFVKNEAKYPWVFEKLKPLLEEQQEQTEVGKFEIVS